MTGVKRFGKALARLLLPTTAETWRLLGAIVVWVSIAQTLDMFWVAYWFGVLGIVIALIAQEDIAKRQTRVTVNVSTSPTVDGHHLGEAIAQSLAAHNAKRSS